MRVYRRIATRLSIALIVIVASSAILMGMAITRSGNELLINAATGRLAQESKLVQVKLQDIFNNVQQDVEFITSNPSTLKVVAALEPATTSDDTADQLAQATSALEDQFATLLANHPWYSQIRLIGVADRGRELVRVDRGGNDIIRVAHAALQQKGDREYFQNALDEPPEKVFWSAIELNQENGKLVDPIQPVIRAAMPVSSKYGSPIGLVVINLDIRRAFNAARELLEPDINLYIANEAGDYLFHPDENMTFGFERGQRHLIQDDFSDSALATFGKSSVILEDILLPGNSESVMAHLSRLPVSVKSGSSLIIGLTRPRTAIVADVNRARDKAIRLILPFTLVSLAVVVWLVELFIGPLQRVTREIERYTPGRKLLLPEQRRKDEVGRLAQAFCGMATRINQQVTQLEQQGSRFFSLFEAIPDAVLIIDEDGSIEYCNSATEKLFGYSDDELFGHNISMLMPDPDRSQHDGYIRHYLETGEAHIIGSGRKVTGLHKQGELLPLYLSIGEFILQGRRKFTGILHTVS